jgi:hypothetical protein
MNTIIEAYKAIIRKFDEWLNSQPEETQLW